MKKVVLIVAMVLIAGTAFAANYGQVSCTSGSATVINPTAGSISASGGYSEVVIMNQTPNVGVYIGNDSSISAATAGIYLSSATGTGFIVNKESGSWYCITSSGTATVGYQVR